MKLMFASDIHGSEYFCLKMKEAWEREGAGRLILLGDLLYHGPRNDLPRDYNPKAVIDILNGMKEHILCVRGNCEAEVDQMVLEFPVLADYAVLFLDSHMLFLTHGHLYNRENLPKMQPGDFLVCGHTHIWAAEQEDGYVYLNPGSVSIPKNNNKSSYMIYENHCFQIKDLDGTTLAEYREEQSGDDFEGFCRVIERLRAKDGCPWDRKQTHESLRTCMVEEAYETLEAIRLLSQTGDYSNLQEELGDILLQVVMHAQIASEEGFFTIQDVVCGIRDKMIRRHPHVFGTAEVENSGQVLQNWEEIKKQEKKSYAQFYQNELDQVPKAFPALLRAQKVLKKAAKRDEKLFTVEGDAAAISEGLERLKGISSQDYSEEAQACIGTMLLHLTNLARQYQVNGEDALREVLEQFIRKVSEEE